VRRRRFKTLEEEIEALEHNPLAQSLLEDLKSQDPERVGQLVSELASEAEHEGGDNGDE